MTVASRFNALLSNITLTEAQKTAGTERRAAVVKALNTHYWGSSSETANSKYVGSWGKFTRIRPPRDVDVLYTLPVSVYNKYESRTGNKQSQILQEVRGVLSASFPSTNIQGDGPVVKVPFSAYNVELIPAFQLQGGGYWVCMTKHGGEYRNADYDAEMEYIKTSNESTNGNTRDLVRMMKCWQAHCSVPLKSFWIELIAIEFLQTWMHRGKSATYYDWMVRDFLRHLETRVSGNLYAPGTYELMYLGDSWLSKATAARQCAETACGLEADLPYLAGEEWQMIFGTEIPRST